MSVCEKGGETRLWVEGVEGDICKILVDFYLSFLVNYVLAN